MEDSHKEGMNEVVDTNQNQKNMDTTPVCATSCPPSFPLLGDNLDKNVKARYIRIDNHQNKSLHLFHLCAVRDRINFSNLPNNHMVGCLNSPHNCAKELLPTATNYSALCKDCCPTVSCVV